MVRTRNGSEVLPQHKGNEQDTSAVLLLVVAIALPNETRFDISLYPRSLLRSPLSEISPRFCREKGQRARQRMIKVFSTMRQYARPRRDVPLSIGSSPWCEKSRWPAHRATGKSRLEDISRFCQSGEQALLWAGLGRICGQAIRSQSPPHQ